MRTCTICGHPARAEIDRALVAGTTYRDISLRFQVGVMAVQRHKAHIPAQLAQAAAAEQVSAADKLLAEVERLHQLALSLLANAAKAGDLRTALAGIREARGCLELEAKIRGELDERPVMNFVLAPEWVRTRSSLLLALTPFPEAKIAVAAALSQLEA
jgi:hypothetical protein